MSPLEEKIWNLMPDNPKLFDLQLDSLSVLRELGIVFEHERVYTRGEMIQARLDMARKYITECYRIRRVVDKLHPFDRDVILHMAITIP